MNWGVFSNNSLRWSRSKQKLYKGIIHKDCADIRIDANTDDIVTNVGGAQRELLKYYARVTSNRWLMIKIFGVLIIFFLLWVLVS
jgi:hypothetical protein